MPMYIKNIYPYVETGKSHARPSLPDCCVRIHEITTTWNIHSLNDDDRAEYWEVDESKHDAVLCGPLMTAAQVELEVYGPSGKAAWMAANPPPA